MIFLILPDIDLLGFSAVKCALHIPKSIPGSLQCSILEIDFTFARDMLERNSSRADFLKYVAKFVENEKHLHKNLHFWFFPEEMWLSPCLDRKTSVEHCLQYCSFMTHCNTENARASLFTMRTCPERRWRVTVCKKYSSCACAKDTKIFSGIPRTCNSEETSITLLFLFFWESPMPSHSSKTNLSTSQTHTSCARWDYWEYWHPYRHKYKLLTGWQEQYLVLFLEGFILIPRDQYGPRGNNTRYWHVISS